uniref:Uncharacterized protein n=1 Tax=Loxodonta africana TaxID=9785 RepID=G3UGM3_LOXAF
QKQQETLRFNSAMSYPAPTLSNYLPSPALPQDQGSPLTSVCPLPDTQ